SSSPLPSKQSRSGFVARRHRYPWLSQTLTLSLQINALVSKTSNLCSKLLRCGLSINNSNTTCPFFGYPSVRKLLSKAHLHSFRLDCLARINHDAGCITAIFLGESTTLTQKNIFRSTYRARQLICPQQGVYPDTPLPPSSRPFDRQLR